MYAALIASSVMLAFSATPLRLSNGTPKVYPVVRQPTPEAYFVFQWADMFRPATFPSTFQRYTLFVCAASMSQSDVAQMEFSLPDGIKLAYGDAQNLEVANSRSGTFYDSFEAAFATAFGTDTTCCVRNLTTGSCVRMDQIAGASDTHPSWIPFQASADVFVEFHRSVTLAQNNRWDGLYLDDCTATYPAWRQDILQDILDASQTFDIDGDNVADTVQDAVDQWATWRPYLTAQLREMMGETRVFVANSGGTLSDSCLNGITIEGIGHTVTKSEASASFQAQRAVGHSPFYGVGWVTTATTDAIPTRQLTEEIPGVYYGVVSE